MDDPGEYLKFHFSTPRPTMGSVPSTLRPPRGVPPSAPRPPRGIPHSMPHPPTMGATPYLPYGLPMFVPTVPIPVPIWEQPPPPMEMWYAEYFANTPVFRDPGPALAIVKEIKQSAKRSLQSDDYIAALWKYQHAISVCRNHELVDEEAVINANCAFVALKMEEGGQAEMMAYNYASRCIALKPDFEKAYYRRAEAAKRLILDGRATLILHDNPCLGMLTDYWKCFTMNPETIEALAEAVLLAVDFGLTRQLPNLNEKLVADGIVTKLYNHLIEKMPTSRVKMEHLEFVIFKLQSTKFDASEVEFTKLVERDAIHDDFLNKMLRLGMKIKDKDIKDLIHILPDGKAIKVLEFAIAHCPPSGLPAALLLAAKAAVKSNKLQFLVYLVDRGATPSVGDIIDIVNWSKPHQGLLKYIATHGSQEEISPLVYNALSQKQFKTLCTLIQLGGANVAKHVSIVPMDVTDMTGNMALLEELAKQGVNLGRVEVVAKVLKVEPVTTKVVDLLCFLLKQGARCSYLRQCRFQNSTPLHAATELALESGNTNIIQLTVQSVGFELPADGRVFDERGQCPYHLVAKSQRSMDVKVKVCKALSSLLPLLDPTTLDKGSKKKKGHGKSAKEYATQGSEIYKCLANAEAAFLGTRPVQADAPVGATSEPISYPPTDRNGTEESSLDSKGNTAIDEPRNESGAQSNDSHQPSSPNQGTESLLNNEEVSGQPLVITTPLDMQLSRLLQLDEDYFSFSKVTFVDTDVDYVPTSMVDDLTAREALLYCQGLKFDNFAWEVEFTPSLRLFFKKVRREHPTLLSDVISRFADIAQCKPGWNSLSTPLPCNGVELFQTEVEGCRVLWEKATQYSPFVTKKANTADHFYYVQILRLWDVSTALDQASDAYISDCIERIQSSYRRGRHAAIQLTPINDQLSEGANTPGCYFVTHEGLDSLPSAEPGAQSHHLFLPAASMREGEYCAVPFYALSDTFVRALCASGTSSRYDFPHKPWPTEDHIISLDPRKAVLLLGRSGTGKTTCCLHRLWVHFRDYWANGREDPGIPRNTRTPLSVLSSIEPSGGDIGDDGMEEDEPELEGKTPEMFEDAVDHVDGDVVALGSEDDDAEEAAQNRFEHLKQIFVTKNPVLCSQLKRKFYDFAAAHSYLNQHMECEKMRVPDTLPEVLDRQYPLFITSQQFLLLLDRTLPGESLFGTKDPNRLRILSAEYDFDEHEMMVELHDSEGEEEEEGEGGGAHVPQHGRVMVWTEITATYFTKTVWPKISRHCPLKNLDPALVWTEIKSFIKGSAEALLRQQPLDLEEYEKVGKKLAPNYAEERKVIYNLFEAYNQFRQNCASRIFDECDLIHNIYRRLIKMGKFHCLPHRFYVDEVQDFTQAELMLILACCQDPNGLFFTGDTAQSIMQGVAFRFKDLRSIFRLVSKGLPEVQLPTIYKLVTNFRSHAGILRLAGTVIDLLLCFFKQSFDSSLPRDKGILEGPHPVLLWSPDIDDLAFLLKIQKRDSSVIEFGAHQVVIVRSKEVRQGLPKIFESAIVLTVFEAKGLEFDDVLLYNFFSDSLVDSKGWRVISNYLNNNPDQVTTNLPSGFTSKNSRPTPFDPRQHKALNSELKCLYTAVTRAKSNLWIYDSNEENRHPMFEYWFKRGVVRGTGSDGRAQADLIFASVSSKEQWKAQGDYFKRKHLYDQAIQCYTKSGDEFLYLMKEVQACKLIQDADAERALYTKAAVLLLEADELHHDIRYLSNAAVCLMKTQPPKYVEAAKLYEKLGKADLAFSAFKKGRYFSDCVRIKEGLGLYTEAVEVLEKAKMRTQALQHSSRYEKSGHTLSADMSTSTLAHKYARLYAKQKDQAKLEAVIDYIPDPVRRVRYWKESGRYQKALDIYIEEKLYDSAYRLISGQGWYDKGLEYAEKIGKTDWRVNFTIQKAQYKLCTESGTLDGDTVSSLQGLLQIQDAKVRRLQAVATVQLLLGRGTGNRDYLSQAIEGFRLLNHKIGELEAYGQLFQIVKHEYLKGPKDARVVLDICQKAQECVSVLAQPDEKNLLAKLILQQSLDLYGLKAAGDVYCAPPNQNIWVKGLKQCEVRDEPYDLDGMVRLDMSKTREALSSHLSALSEQFYKDTGIENFLCAGLTQAFNIREFCKQLGTGLLKTPSFLLDANVIMQYITIYAYWIEYSCLTSKSAEPRSAEGPIRQLLVLYQPNFSICLPLGRHHLMRVHSFVHVCSAIHSWIKKVLDRITSGEEACLTDVWLTLWRASCIAGRGGPNAVDLMGKVKSLTNDIRNTAKLRGQSYRAPAAYIFLKRENLHHHHFFFWLRSCELIRKDKDVTSAAECVVKHLLPHIAYTAKRGGRISVMNVVEMLCLHSTALLTIITCVLWRHRLSLTFKVRVPHMYHHVVQVFDNLNAPNKGDRWLLKACGDQVDEAWRNHRVKRVSSRALELLCSVLELLVGYQKFLPVLKFALADPSLVASGASCHCLILALTVLANLAVACRSSASAHLHFNAKSIEERCSEGFKALCDILSAANDVEGCPGYVRDACNVMCSQEWSGEVFGLIQYLVQQCYPDSGVAEIARINYSEIVFKPIKCRSKLFSTSVPSDLEVSNIADEGSGYDDITSSQQEEFTEEYSEQTEEEVQLEGETETDELKITEASLVEEQPQQQHLLEDKYVMDRKYCTLCDVELDSQQAGEVEEGKDEQDGKEGTEAKDGVESTAKLQLFEDHVQSQVHIDRKKTFEKYTEVEEVYSKTLNAMLKVLEELTHASKVYYDEDSPFAELLDKMETEKENSGTECEKIKENKNWQEGITKLQSMLMKVHDLTLQGRIEAEKISKRLPLNKARHNVPTNIEEEPEDVDINLDIEEQ